MSLRNPEYYILNIMHYKIIFIKIVNVKYSNSNTIVKNISVGVMLISVIISPSQL